MQFRIKHLFIGTAIVAFLSMALANPEPVTLQFVRLLVWMSVATLLVRAICRRDERIIIGCGISASISYLAVVHILGRGRQLATSALLDWLRPEILYTRINGRLEADGYKDFASPAFKTIGEIMYAVVFGLLAAGLAWYWTRKPRGDDPPDVASLK